MSNVFITGDRQLTSAYGPLVAIEMLKAQAVGSKIVTTDMNGVAAMVRDLAQRAGVDIDVIPAPTDKADWDMFHSAVGQSFDPEFVVVHVDPHTSSVTKSVLAVAHEDKVRIVTHADLAI